jgi:hypothetical protein
VNQKERGMGLIGAVSHLKNWNGSLTLVVHFSPSFCHDVRCLQFLRMSFVHRSLVPGKK